MLEARKNAAAQLSNMQRGIIKGGARRQLDLGGAPTWIDHCPCDLAVTRSMARDLPSMLVSVMVAEAWRG